jgi:hypothetical protein
MFHAFTASSSHVGAAWTSDIYKIDFLAFQLLDLSPRNHVRLENSVSIPNFFSAPYDSFPSTSIQLGGKHPLMAVMLYRT